MATAMMVMLAALELVPPQDRTTMRRDMGLDAMMAQHEAEWDAVERIPFDGVLVLDRGDNTRTPQCGIYASYLAIKGRLPTGETSFFYMSWCTAGQAAPPISGLCHFDVRADSKPPGGFISGENDLPERWDGSFDRTYNMVEHFDCGITSENVMLAQLEFMPETVEAPPPDERSRTVTIVGMGSKPWESGGSMTSLLLMGRSDDGDIDPYYLTYFGETQPIPSLGSRCLLRLQPTRLEMVGGLTIVPGLSGEAIQSFQCVPPRSPASQGPEGPTE